jgi:ribose/xylose/arabinose/galactoside ABC-type transport system permease subunit
LLNGAIVVGLRMHPFIVTLGTMSIFRGIGNVRVTEKHLPSQDSVMPDSFTQLLTWSPKGQPYVQPVPVVIMLFCVAVGWFYLSLMVGGRENYAVGGNEEAARFSGIRVAWVKLRVYALSGLAAGIAGFVAAGYYGSASTNMGSGYELTVIAAAVVGGASLTGGRGTALGALLGALVIKLIENGIFILNLNKEYSSIIIGIAIIIAVAIDRFSEHLRQRRLAGARRI